MGGEKCNRANFKDSTAVSKPGDKGGLNFQGETEASSVTKWIHRGLEELCGKNMDDVDKTKEHLMLCMSIHIRTET